MHVIYVEEILPPTESDDKFAAKAYVHTRMVEAIVIGKIIRTSSSTSNT